MLANTLSVEDEEAVQAELRELQAEAVSVNVLRNVNHAQNAIQDVEETERPITLPSVPETAPVSKVQEGKQPQDRYELYILTHVYQEKRLWKRSQNGPESQLLHNEYRAFFTPLLIATSRMVLDSMARYCTLL